MHCAHYIQGISKAMSSSDLGQGGEGQRTEHTGARRPY